MQALTWCLHVLACCIISYLPVQGRWKSQSLCSTILETLVGVPFQTMRPPWLVNPLTKHCLELDCYNEALGLALEYNGEQHYKPVPCFHRGKDRALEMQVFRDEIKKSLCDQHRVILIIVPYTIPKAHLTSYILDKLQRIGFH